MSIAPNVLVLTGGKWVGRVLQLKETMRGMPEFQEGELIVADIAEVTPAGCFADATVVVPPIHDPQYIEKLMEVCVRHTIRVVIPVIDLDLERLAPHVRNFSSIGATVVCPSPELVELCLDKSHFEAFTREEGLAYPRTYTAEKLNEAAYPLFFKRRKGFGSIGCGVCASAHEAHRILQFAPDTVFQEYIEAPEVSVDAYISARGKCIVCVPRVRDKVVGGEAYLSHTVRDEPVRSLALRTIDALAKRGLRGPLNVQMFSGERPTLVEVNTRLGSASVLSNIASGGRLFTALLNEASGNVSDGNPNDYIDNLKLYRFLGEVYYTGSAPMKVMPAPELEA